MLHSTDSKQKQAKRIHQQQGVFARGICKIILKQACASDDIYSSKHGVCITI